jgi:hypothetical protein
LDRDTSTTGVHSQEDQRRNDHAPMAATIGKAAH